MGECEPAGCAVGGARGVAAVAGSQKRGPATAIVRGSIYNRPGKWQELRVAEVPRLLADQVRVMRATPGASIDSNEAYVDAIVLLVPGNPTGTDVGTDDLAVDGVVMPSERVSRWRPIADCKCQARAGVRPRWASAALRRAVQPAGVARGKDCVRNESGDACGCRGRRCMSMGGRFLPRVIQWNGEPLQFLSACGFNVVQLPGAPTPAQSAEAEKLGPVVSCVRRSSQTRWLGGTRASW